MAHPDQATLRSYCDYLLPAQDGPWLDSVPLPQRGRAYALLAEGLRAAVPDDWELRDAGLPSEHWRNKETGVTQVAHPVDSITRECLLTLLPASPHKQPSPRIALGAAAGQHAAELREAQSRHARELEVERAAHAAGLAALQEAHRAEAEAQRAAQARQLEAQAQAHAAVLARLEQSQAALEGIEAQRARELQGARAALEAAGAMRAQAEAQALAVREAAEAVGEAAEAVEGAVQTLLDRGSSSAGAAAGAAAEEGAGLLHLSMREQQREQQQREQRAVPRPLPSPPPPPSLHAASAAPAQYTAAWYAARAREELARCGVFEDGLEMQRGELAAAREALEADYKGFKREVQAVAGLSGQIGGEAGSAATIRARQASLRLAKAQLEGRIAAVNLDILQWNQAVAFSKEREQEAGALLEEASGDIRLFIEARCREREKRLFALDLLEVAAAAKQGRQREAGGGAISR